MVCSCFGIKCRADAFVLFYFYSVSFSFHGMRGNKYALEVFLYDFISVCLFAFCFSSCLFLSTVEKSFTFPLLSVA